MRFAQSVFDCSVRKKYFTKEILIVENNISHIVDMWLKHRQLISQNKSAILHASVGFCRTLRDPGFWSFLRSANSWHAERLWKHFLSRRQPSHVTWENLLRVAWFAWMWKGCAPSIPLTIVPRAGCKLAIRNSFAWSRQRRQGEDPGEQENQTRECAPDVENRRGLF